MNIVKKKSIKVSIIIIIIIINFIYVTNEVSNVYFKVSPCIHAWSSGGMRNLITNRQANCLVIITNIFGPSHMMWES